ncbi:MAG: S24/S26 family peptidase [Chromatiaceae bacterium]|nr:S24/S26 family peptidase [Chromatiaceae bacterium]
MYGADGCLAAVLASGEGMVVHVNGTCMEPVIGDRARARIEPVRRLSPGDVIAVRSAPEGTGVLMHRFLGPVWTPGGWRLMTMADAANRPDPLAEDAQVLGKVVALNTCTYRVTLPVRALALARYAYWTLRLAIRRLVRG